MAIKKSVFGSGAEKENYRKLRRSWGDRYALYHNLPFLNVFSVKAGDCFVNPHTVALWSFTLSDIDIQRLKKTSIDYVLCDHEGAPLVCVEFDGMNEGYNAGSHYRSRAAEDNLSEASHAWRRQIMELKLNIAHSHFFPLFVVGYKEFQDLSTHIKLSIVDGIIGDVIANMESRKKFSAFDPSEMGITQEEFDTLLPDIRDDLVQDWIIGVELEAGYEHNPIMKEQARLRGFLASVMGEHPSLSYSYLDANKTSARGDYIGSEVVLRTKAFGDIKQTAWIPDFQSPCCSGPTLVESIAELLALDRARTLYQRKLSAQEFSR